MARPLRIEYQGACYHVMNRGNRRQTVFESEADVDLFLNKLGEFSASYDVDIFCYCLMHNHFHLYLRTREANLSKFMQALLTSFTITKNKRDRSSGHLFQGRYKAILVEDSVYGSELSRYIHLNPVRTAFSSSLDLKKKRELLRNTKLSSYPSVIGIAKKEKWYSPKYILKSWGETVAEQRKKYAEYVESGLLCEIDDPLKLSVAQSILGSEKFIDKIRRSLSDLSENLNIRRELGAETQFLSSMNINKVIDAVSQFYNVEKEYILTKNSRNNEPRQVLLYLSCKYCRGKYSLSELGSKLGPLTVGAITRSRYNMAGKIRNDKKLESKIKKIENDIVKS